MSAKTSAEVVIDGKVYTLSGYEGEEYLQKVAAYINNKIIEFDAIEDYRHLPLNMKNTLIQLNIADDYFKAKDQVTKLENDLEQKEKEIYDLKHDLFQNQVKTETAEASLKELEAANKELLLNKARLEASLEDKLLDGKKLLNNIMSGTDRNSHLFLFYRMNMRNRDFELLAPAGNINIFKAVIEAGADAVYVGGSMFGARAYANNFDEEELLYAIDYAHLKGVKVYLTVNTLLKNDEIEKLYDYLLPFYERGLDAVLVQDLGALKLIHDRFPDLAIHTSTQMTVTGIDSVRFLKQFGVQRVVMAREVSLAEMKEIHEKCGMEIEAFVHGALCYSYSGQCLFSSMLGGRSGNRGRCAQPCRLPYCVGNKKDTYILSLKDMCGIKDLQKLKESGVYSLKIEGRMKQAGYASGVVAYYRRYIDSMKEVSDKDYKNIAGLGNRCGFTDKYYFEHNGTDMVTFEKPNFVSDASDELPQFSKIKIQGN